jgi:hypothetical protein
MSDQKEQDNWVTFDIWIDATPNTIRSEEDKERFAKHFHHQLDEKMDAILARKTLCQLLRLKSREMLDT